MHGLIFTSFHQFTAAHRADHTEAIWDGRPPFLPGEIYPDEQFEELLGDASGKTGESRRTMLIDFGRFTATTVFRQLRPEFYDEAGGTRRFLLDVEERIQEVLRASTPGAAPPRLQVHRFGSDGVAISYISARRLCELLEGLVLGTAEFYGERFAIDQPTCMHRGDDACAFFVSPLPA